MQRRRQKNLRALAMDDFTEMVFSTHNGADEKMNSESVGTHYICTGSNQTGPSSERAK